MLPAAAENDRNSRSEYLCNNAEKILQKSRMANSEIDSFPPSNFSGRDQMFIHNVNQKLVFGRAAQPFLRRLRLIKIPGASFAKLPIFEFSCV
jgi:hypothetical protein